MDNDELNVLPCSAECLTENKGCLKSECKHWIDFEEDNNCSQISILKHGKMTLDQIAKRLKLSIVRISQIEKQALVKVRKRINNI